MKSQDFTTRTTINTYSIPTPYEMGCMTKVQQMNWNLVFRALHYSGDLRIEGTTRQIAWVLANGFGKMNIHEIDTIIEWDWSHIRDSTPEAIEEIAAFLRRSGCKDKGAF